MPNTNSRRGRPSLNNVQRLYDLLLEFYNRNEALPLRAIARQFDWTNGTARAMISQVRSQMGVVIRYNRYQESFRLSHMPVIRDARNVTVTATITPDFAAPAVSARPVEAPDSLWLGIAPEVASFYRERSLDLRV